MKYPPPPFFFTVISCIHSVPVLVFFLTRWLRNTATFYSVYWLLRPLKSKFPLEQVCLWRFLLCTEKLELCLVSGRPFTNMRGVKRWMTKLTKLTHRKLNNQGFDISLFAPKGFREGWPMQTSPKKLNAQKRCHLRRLMKSGLDLNWQIREEGFLFVCLFNLKILEVFENFKNKNCIYHPLFSSNVSCQLNKYWLVLLQLLL